MKAAKLEMKLIVATVLTWYKFNPYVGAGDSLFPPCQKVCEIVGMVFTRIPNIAPFSV